MHAVLRVNYSKARIRKTTEPDGVSKLSLADIVDTHQRALLTVLTLSLTDRQPRILVSVSLLLEFARRIDAVRMRKRTEITSREEIPQAFHYLTLAFGITYAVAIVNIFQIIHPIPILESGAG